MRRLALGKGLCRRFGSDRSGQVALIFALAAIPMLGMAGAAIDYAHLNSVKIEMQSALDATALALSKTAGTMTPGQLQARAQSYFNAEFQVPDAKNVTLSPSYTTSGGSTVVLKASATIPTYFVNVMGFKSMKVAASSTVKWGSPLLRVALVLDNTGSMAQNGKMQELKTATKNLLSQLQSAATTNGDVYVSIVPFVKDVNVGASNYAASWIDWMDWNAANGRCSNAQFKNRSTCVSGRGRGNGYARGHGNGGYGNWHGGNGKHNGNNHNPGTWTPADHNTWNGCVEDRGDETGPDPANYDTNVVAPTSSIAATLFPAEQYSSCPQAAMGLSYNWSAMTTLVNNMRPSGNTNQAIGLALGWMSLVGGGPFTVPPENSDTAYSHVIILLTDGMNTQDRWYSSQSKIDARQTMTCNNIKAAGITLYTVQVSTDGTPRSSLLQSCASDSGKFFYLTSSSEIVTTFNTIGTNLSNLYLAK